MHLLVDGQEARFHVLIVWKILKTLVGNSGTCAIEPRALVHVSGRNKGRGGHLLGVEAEADTAGAVLALGKGSWDGLGGEFIVEAGLVSGEVCVRLAGAS